MTSGPTVVKARTGVRAGVGAIGVAAVVGGLAAVILIPALAIFAFPVGVVGVMLLYAALSWGKVTQVVVDAEGVTIRAGEYSRHIPRAEVGGAWLVGPLFGGWALDLGLPGLRPVLLAFGDPQGQVVVARRIAWVRERDLAQAFAAHGIPYAGETPYSFGPAHLRWSAWPPDVVPPAAGPGRDDPATKAEIARLRKRARLQALAGWAAIFGLPRIAGSLHAGVHQQPLYGFTAFLSTAAFVAFWIVVFGLIRSRPWRTARKILRDRPWVATEVALLGVNTGISTQRYVVVLDRSTGWPQAAYAVAQGGEHGWLQPVERRWLLLASKDDGKKAIASPPDRSGLAVLVKGDLAKVLALAGQRGAG